MKTVITCLLAFPRPHVVLSRAVGKSFIQPYSAGGVMKNTYDQCDFVFLARVGLGLGVGLGVGLGLGLG